MPFPFGFEGYLNLNNLELLISGSYEGRLGWSSTGSSLSRHGLDEVSERPRPGSKSKIEKSSKEQNIYEGLDPMHPGSKPLEGAFISSISIR